MSWHRIARQIALALVLSAAVNSTSEGRIVRSRSDLYYGPRVIRYDAEKDELIHQESIIMRPQRQPGGAISYSGTRLHQYQFHGKPGRGGVYDALEDYSRERQLDPKKYQYRPLR
jgi:hypothetical protein